MSPARPDKQASDSAYAAPTPASGPVGPQQDPASPVSGPVHLSNDAIQALAASITDRQEQMQRERDAVEAEQVAVEARQASTVSLVLGVMAIVAGAAIGLYIQNTASDEPLTNDIPGNLMFLAMCAGVPFGWHATRSRGDVVYFSLILAVLRFTLSLAIGIPCMVFYTLRTVYRLVQARKVQRTAQEVQVDASTALHGPTIDGTAS